MPKIFTDEKRQEIARQLLDAGLELIRQFGVQKLRVEDITKRVGIAQGTFYNFYASREMLIFALIERYQLRINDRLQAIVDSKGFLDRGDLKILYTGIMLEDEDNILRFVSQTDIQILATRLPKECVQKLTDSRGQIERNLERVINKKENVDISAVINWVQMMNFAVQNSDLLIKEGLPKIMSGLIENMLDEIFIQE